MSFIGKYYGKTDAKNRVFLPALFRKLLSQTCPDAQLQLVVRKDIFEKCLVIYPMEQWEGEVAKLRSGLNRFDSVKQMVYRKMVSDAVYVTPDNSGRILLPKQMLDSVGISEGVLFVGMEQTIEIWASESENGAETIFMSDEDFAESIRKMMSE
ncbi:MAG: cell division/cell wall cluster transcriptional repressor MraZ [Bacteroidaceae bacterium]|nr:cell division/cell wall cluster transcriptional repressor MraZ [Bacteroidaceae bacterium]